jgi:hypothetical protein
MALYKDDIIQRLHGLIGDGYNVRHAMAKTIHEHGEAIVTWARVVVEREIEGSEDPRVEE